MKARKGRFRQRTEAKLRDRRYTSFPLALLETFLSVLLDLENLFSQKEVLLSRVQAQRFGSKKHRAWEANFEISEDLILSFQPSPTNMDSDDELELIEEHDLEASSQDSRSDIESSRRRNKKNSTTNTSTSRRRRRKLGPNDDPFASDNDSLISASDQDPDPYNPDNQQDQEGEQQDEEATRDSHFQLLKSTVIDITSALGGIEERLDDRDRIVKEYVIGDDCLRE